MKPRIFLFTLSLLAMLGCVHDPVQTTFDPAYPERNGAGDSILAVFEGRIPCAIEGCEKRKVVLVFYGRDEGRVPTSYWLGVVGIGNDSLVQQGVWTTRRGVQEYPNGLVYILDSKADPSLQFLWRVNDEIILVLDQDLRPKAGDAAWGYMLSRDCAAYGPRTYPYDKRTKQFVATVSTSNCPPPNAKD
jgi:hypothetical protein